MINEVAVQHDIALQTALNSGEDAELRDKALEDIDSLKNLGQRLRQMPVWPFDIPMQIGVILNIIVPFVFSWLVDKLL